MVGVEIKEPRLILLPGLDGTGLLLQAFLAALSTEVSAKVVAYPTHEALNLSELAMLVLRQLPSEKPVLLAESFSGLVALTLLASASARIRGIIFVGSFAEPPRPLLLRMALLVSRSPALIRSAPAFLLRQYCLGKEATAAQLKVLRDAITLVSPGIVAQRLAMVASRHSFGRTAIKVPSYYIQPTEDRLVPASCVSWFQQRFERCEVERIDGPHFLLQAKPQESAQVVTKLVRLLTAGPRPTTPTDGAAATPGR